MSVFVEDSWNIDDIDTREYVDFCCGGTLREIRYVDNIAHRGPTHMVDPNSVAADEKLKGICVNEGPGFIL